MPKRVSLSSERSARGKTALVNKQSALAEVRELLPVTRELPNLKSCNSQVLCQKGDPSASWLRDCGHLTSFSTQGTQSLFRYNL